MNYLLLVISLAAALAYNASRKVCMEKYILNQRDLHLFNALTGTVTVAVLAVLMLIRGEFRALPSLYTVLLGAVFGLITVVSAVLNMKAYAMGPMSYTIVFISCSMVLPALYGTTRGEHLSWVHYVGIVMVLICMVLSVSRDKERKKANVAWFVCCMVTFLLVGAIGIIQQIHQTSDAKSELDFFLLIAFAVYVVYSVVSYLLCAGRESAEKPDYSPKKPLFAMFIVTGLGVAAVNVINMYLSGVMPSAVFFPVINGGGLITSALFGILVFRETFSAKKWVGLGVGTGAILLLCFEQFL